MRFRISRGILNQKQSNFTELKIILTSIPRITFKSKSRFVDHKNCVFFRPVLQNIWVGVVVCNFRTPNLKNRSCFVPLPNKPLVLSVHGCMYLAFHALQTVYLYENWPTRTQVSITILSRINSRKDSHYFLDSMGVEGWSRWKKILIFMPCCIRDGSFIHNIDNLSFPVYAVIFFN